METALGEGEMYESSSKSQNFLETNYLTDVCDSNVITLWLQATNHDCKNGRDINMMSVLYSTAERTEEGVMIGAYAWVMS